MVRVRVRTGVRVRVGVGLRLTVRVRARVKVPVPMRAPKVEVAPVQSHLSAGQMGAARPSTMRPQLSTHLG